jgi:hypothetical protein
MPEFLRTLKQARRAAAITVRLALRSQRLLRFMRFPGAAKPLLDPFRAEPPIAAEAYEDLVRYFAAGWHTYRHPGGHAAAYQGLPSWSGEEADDLEGFSRIMPLFAAWCASGREQEIQLPGGGALSLPEAFRAGLVAGTDPAAATYWGAMPGKSNQRIVEAADIAVTLWMFRDSVWASLGDHHRSNVVNWLSQLNGRPGLDNNWHLFFVLVDRVLDGLGYPGRIPSARKRFERIKEFHCGNGWFRDGPEGRVDFYSGWGFHYALWWIDRIDPSWDPEFIRDSQHRFVETYRHLIGPNGIPIFGRSVCYRIAAPAPLILAAARDRDAASEGQARRALDVVWSYFIRNGAIRNGRVTQGYFGDDPRVLDPYSGPASPLWSLRSLVAAFQHPRGGTFWTSPGLPLPVEEDSYEIRLHDPRWIIRGDQATGTISIEVLENDEDASPALRPVPRVEPFRSLAFGTPWRPPNTEAQYGRRIYRSNPSFLAD